MVAKRIFEPTISGFPEHWTSDQMLQIRIPPWPSVKDFFLLGVDLGILGVATSQPQLNFSGIVESTFTDVRDMRMHLLNNFNAKIHKNSTRLRHGPMENRARG